ncbi:MAG: sugar phosphate isomerase/epimerase family protein [Desulfobacterales bacterium]
MQDMIPKIQVNVPFRMLYENYLDQFLEHRLNPEIGIDALALERFAFSDFKHIAHILDDHNLTVTLHGPFIDLSAGSADPAVAALTRHRFEQLLNLVPLFKPRSVVCHAGYDWKRYGYSKAQWIENSLNIWTWLATCIKERGSRLVLENVYEKEPDEIRVVLEPLKNFGAGFCLDCGHLFAFGNANLEDWLNTLGSYIAQLHLHDNHGGGDEHLAIGSGTIDFKFLFRYLKSISDSPPIITLEPHQEGDLWPSLAYLAKIWPW